MTQCNCMTLSNTRCKRQGSKTHPNKNYCFDHQNCKVKFNLTPPVKQVTPPVKQVTPPVKQVTPPVKQVTPPVKQESLTFDSFNILKKLGEGTYGKVSLVESKIDRTKYIMKEFSKRDSYNQELYFYKFINCKNENLLCLINNFDYKNKYYIIVKYIDNLMELWGCYKLKLNDILKIFIDVSNGLKFLHDNNLVHLDIKPTNILVDKDTYKAYLIDYGLSCVYNNINKFNCNNQNFVGVTYKYFPAEVINLSENKKYGIGPYTDIYSLGITFKEMLLKNNIKPSKQLKELLNDMTSFNDITDRPDIVCVINELTKMLK